MGVKLQEWSNVLRTEYLSSYIRQGGAAVKFAVIADETAASRVKAEVREDSSELGYLFAEVDASTTRIHLMQDLFHAVARKVPWVGLARDLVRRCYNELGRPVHGDDLRCKVVAAQHGEEPNFLSAEMNRALQGLLPLSSALAKDFRYAMLWMCIDQLRAGASGGPDTEVILQWLYGDLKPVSAVKPFLIFRKIGRHNARAMLTSLGAWCRLTGMAGLVLSLDIRQLAVARRVDGAVHYTASAVMDAYEVLRQLVDAQDDLVGVLSVVISSPELFEDERRGVKVYKALYERVWPDVRLREQANPLSALSNVEVY